MKLLLLLTSVLISINAFTQGPVITEESSPGACDGYAIIDYGYVYNGDYIWLSTTQDSTITGVLLSNADTLTNLCAGDYALQYHDSLFNISNYDTLYHYFSLASADSTCSNFTLNGTATNETSAGACDGSINTSVFGENGTVSYSWSNASSTANITGVCAGTYVLTATDTATCVTTATFVVGSDNICSNFFATTTSTNETVAGCDGTATAVVNNANGAVTYAWSTGSTLSSISGLCPGTYTLTVSDSSACSDSVQVYIYQDSTCSNFLVYGAATNESSLGACDGSATTTVTGATGVVSYLWSNGATTQNLTNLCAGTYTITATDNTSSCVSTDSIVVGSDNICSNFSVVATSVSETSLGACDGTAVANVTNENGWVTYAWNNGGTGTTLTNLCQGTYVVTATDSASCSATYTVFVGTDSTATSPLQLIITTNNESAAGACDGVVNAMVTGGVQPYTYSYSFGGTNTPMNTGVCTGYYTVNVYDAAGDSISGLFVITSPTTTFDTYNYPDSTVTDTIFTGPIATCLFDFGSIDTAFISSTVFLGNDSLQLTWTVIDSSGINQIIADYYVGGLSQGVYTFSLSLFCGNKAIDNVFTLIDSYYVQTTSLGIDDLNEEAITVYPNPFMDKITLQVPSSLVGSQFKLIDINGRVMLENTFRSEKQTLQMSELANGQYFIVTEQSSIRIQKN